MRQLDSYINAIALQLQPTPRDGAGLPQTCRYSDGMGDVLHNSVISPHATSQVMTGLAPM
jgi:hypothetical protein